jgi:hypothetical protein
MDLVLRIFGFVMITLLGFFSAHIVLGLALQLNLIAHLPPDDQLRDFRLAYFGGAGWATIAGALIGLACFFSKGKLRRWLMTAPVLIPTIYCILTLIYFSV